MLRSVKTLRTVQGGYLDEEADTRGARCFKSGSYVCFAEIYAVEVPGSSGYLQRYIYSNTPTTLLCWAPVSFRIWTAPPAGDKVPGMWRPGKAERPRSRFVQRQQAVLSNGPVFVPLDVPCPANTTPAVGIFIPVFRNGRATHDTEVSGP